MITSSNGIFGILTRIWTWRNLNKTSLYLSYSVTIRVSLPRMRVFSGFNLLFYPFRLSPSVCPSLFVCIMLFSATCPIYRGLKVSVTTRRCRQAWSRHPAAPQRKEPWLPTTSGWYQTHTQWHLLPWLLFRQFWQWFKPICVQSRTSGLYSWDDWWRKQLFIWKQQWWLHKWSA